MLMFTLSIFASGFDSDLEKKEKSEVSEDAGFDMVSVEVVGFVKVKDDAESPHKLNFETHDFKQYLKNHTVLNFITISQKESQVYNVAGFVGWNC